jgi:hypothetical protein
MAFMVRCGLPWPGWLGVPHPRDGPAGQSVRRPGRGQERQEVADGPGGEQGGDRPGREDRPGFAGASAAVAGVRWDGDGGYASAPRCGRGHARIGPRHHDQVSFLGRLGYRLDEQDRHGDLPGQQVGDVVIGGDQLTGDGGNDPALRCGGAGSGENTPQRGYAPGHGRRVHRDRAAEHVGRHTERGRPPGQLADAHGGSGQHVGARSLVGGDVQPIGLAQRPCQVGVGGDAGHRGRPARAGSQDLPPLGDQACCLRRGQAASPDKRGDLG